MNVLLFIVLLAVLVTNGNLMKLMKEQSLHRQIVEKLLREIRDNEKNS